MTRVLPCDEDELRRRDAALRQLARRCSWSEADAEDAVQESWLKSLVHPPRDSRRHLAWLRVVVVRALGKIQRKQRNERARLRCRGEPGEEPSALDELLWETASARALGWLHMLDEPYREVLRLRYLEDLSAAEIAARLRRREGTVRVQIKRGLDQLRARAGREEKRFAAWLVSLLRLREFPWRSVLACGAVAILAVFTATAVERERPSARPGALRASSGEEPLAAAVLADVRLPSEARISAPFVPPASAISPPASTAMELGTFVSGRCLDDLGGAVANVEIWGASAALDQGELLGRAGGGGHYRVRVPAGIQWLWADEVLRRGDGTEQQRSGSLRVRLPAPPGDSPVDLSFAEGLSTRLSGSVVDWAGAPVAGARVSTVDRWSDAPLDRWQIPPPPSHALTDERGEFDLCLFRSSHQDLWVAKPGHSTVSVRVLPGASRVSIRLPSPAVLTGRLVAADRGVLPRTELRLELAAPLPELATRTDASGRFRFELVPPGDFCVRALPGEVGLSLVQVGRCAEGEVLDLGDLVATESCSLRGLALENGTPVAGWRVVLEEEQGGRLAFAPTADDGSFEFKACRASSHRAWLLEPGAPDGPARAALRDLHPGRSRVRLEAAPASARIHGQVESSLRSTLQVVLDGELLPRPVVVALGPDGSFERRLPAGSYEVTGISRALGRWSFGTLDLVPGETRFLDCRAPATGSLSIRVHPPTGFDRSVLRNLQGQLIGTAYSTTFHAGHLGSPAEIDVERGTLRFSTLLPGEYVVLLYTGSAGGLGAEYRSARIEAGRGAELEVRFEPGHAVKIHRRAERPLLDGERFSCVIESKHGEVRFTASADLPGSLDAMSLFRKLLAAGTYSLRLESDRGLAGALEFSVPSREGYELVLR